MRMQWEMYFEINYKVIKVDLIGLFRPRISYQSYVQHKH